jgi:hypothetical protein
MIYHMKPELHRKITRREGYASSIASVEGDMDEAATRGTIDADDLERLLIDLRRITANAGQWTIGFLPAPCLTGSVTGHPNLADNTCVTTSQLVMFEPSKSWARTLSRLYRLGTPVRV